MKNGSLDDYAFAKQKGIISIQVQNQWQVFWFFEWSVPDLF